MGDKILTTIQWYSTLKSADKKFVERSYACLYMALYYKLGIFSIMSLIFFFRTFSPDFLPLIVYLYRKAYYYIYDKT